MNLYKKERPLRSFVLPNESYKWDFILDTYAPEDGTEREGSTERRDTKRTDGGCDTERVITRHRRKLYYRYI